MDSLWASIRVDWHALAVCGGAPSDLFYPVVETNALLNAVRDRFCDRCPVREKCLNSALINNDEGFWGGTSTEIRRAMKRNRHRTKCPACSNDRLMIVDHDGADPVTPYQVCLACGASWKGKPKADPEPYIPPVEAVTSCA